ncbi:MAG: hypothetical protein A3I69_05065 [Deltaproteobacteria bacterium RIFCSPLOWO2_02_FULL_40_36]|nr:MAG: hypothetical protein A3C45_01040 [Deltaproteobacteria bacterium RIFCSPHIGHO2_02_FULL_40_28]OGQ21033.1 MAG: hypothetical protein A3E27_03705 [Deltaproteobacteria bacterium RIFCSPHIGHO2_12_FULL_40_32]OGQ39434.1 MAG: hypothetical protein A3I69_05065 [Deltaproteobacteria bacterium RIFCSPLOWO2_02_FULL_40_36]
MERMRMKIHAPKIAFYAALLIMLAQLSCASVQKNAVLYKKDHKNYPTTYAIASWYGIPFHGRRTANGETYNMYELTAAHKTLPFGTLLLVTNQKNKKQVLVRINDRGPYVGQRVLDLSFQAAKQIDMIKTGVSSVKIEMISQGLPKRYALK